MFLKYLEPACSIAFTPAILVFRQPRLLSLSWLAQESGLTKATKAMKAMIENMTKAMVKATTPTTVSVQRTYRWHSGVLIQVTVPPRTTRAGRSRGRNHRPLRKRRKVQPDDPAVVEGPEEADVSQRPYNATKKAGNRATRSGKRIVQDQGNLYRC